jgi:CheY-like chemotaxis protein
MPPKVALLFEDNPFCRDLMTEILTEIDFKVTAFASPISYITDKNRCDSCAGNVCADALITDNQMPEMSGLELIQWITDRGCKLANVPKAIISGNWSSEEYEQAQQLGCKIFQKPTSIHKIFQWLDEKK